MRAHAHGGRGQWKHVHSQRVVTDCFGIQVWHTYAHIWGYSIHVCATWFMCVPYVFEFIWLILTHVVRCIYSERSYGWYSLIPHHSSPIPHPSSPIPHPSSLIPLHSLLLTHPPSLIPHRVMCIYSERSYGWYSLMTQHSSLITHA